MTDTEIVHPVPAEEIRPWIASMSTTFLGDAAEGADDPPLWRAGTWDPARSWGARADGRWVATLRTLPRSVTVPGGELTADALTNVTVAATHRRQGLLSRMLGESLQAAHDREDAVSILIAAEWPIYGRFGYAPACEGADYTLRTRLPGSRLPTGPVDSVDSVSHVRQVEASELGQLAPALFAQARLARAGNVDRPDWWWDRQLGRNGVPRKDKTAMVYLVHDGPGGVDGYLIWSSTGNWSLVGELGQITVHDLIATTDEAYLGLWRYLLGIDVVDQVHLGDRPVDEPLPWLLTDGRALRQDHRVDWVWLRILRVGAALSARRYATPGSVVLDVVDDDMAGHPTGRTGYAAGRYLLEGGPDGASCVETNASAQLRVSQRALASAYLGGYRLSSWSVTGAVEELSRGALARADAMFATALAPWCATGF